MRSGLVSAIAVTMLMAVSLQAGGESPGRAGLIAELDPAGVDAYLRNLQAREPDFGKRIIAIARDSLGTPYANGPLGEGPGAPFDADPLMDLARVDCVTFIEQSIALAASHSRQEAHDRLQKIRYKDGIVAFEHRNHFMEADWVVNNRFCRDVSQKLKTATVDATRIIGRKKFFELSKAPDLASKTPNQTLTLTYVPAAEARKAAKRLPSPAIILCIGKQDWLFVLHCGLFIREADGRPMLYQASSTEGKVVASDFVDFFANSGRYLGFTAYAIGKPS
ncbi:MAG TPA: DUF1460 domain-containing protein [Candidatus Hydrogenedentes bacterium]|nr:DUF1460 domain-containing protein [Candidatus Hydrogenedentota bacterium]HPC17112.1 DUF1460 domain-containing protein [Candidatus Hydrogenedentota bacterium]HRT20505.1 DUF1460 domain-containing protein [Candidatus Hydrogenedentota bacterium]HRT65290.1 DUF1460 domain-containing protein [Candidatus Hydrogenedentota bacterium]